MSITFVITKLLWTSGDVEQIPEHKPSSDKHFSICHLNLSINSAHNYIKLSPSKYSLSAYTCAVICTCETYFESDDDANLEIASYHLRTCLCLLQYIILLWDY